MSRSLASVLILSFAVVVSSAQTPVSQLLWQNQPWSNADRISSVVWSSPARNREAADDFDVVGSVTRVIMNGSSGFPPPSTSSFIGVHVRFYDWIAGNPGALLYQVFVPVGAAGLGVVLPDLATIDVTLPTPFPANGRAFVSLQAEFATAGNWDIWLAGLANPQLSAARTRDNLTGASFTQATNFLGSLINADLDMQIWGVPAVAPPLPTDPCGTWQTMTPPAVLGSSSSGLRDLTVVAPDDVWAAGDASTTSAGQTFNVPLIEHWDGASWSIVPSPAPGFSFGGDHFLHCIDASGPNDVWACGTREYQVGGYFGPYLFVLHWDGSQWSNVSNVPQPANTIGNAVDNEVIYAVEALGPSDVWFAGDWRDVVPGGQVNRPGLLMHWNGTSFQLTNLAVPATAAGRKWLDVEGIATNDVWAVGGTYLGSGAASTSYNASQAAHWNGSQWSIVNVPVPAGPTVLYDVEASGPNDVWMLGVSNPTSLSATTFMMHWNGSTWTQLAGPPSGGSLRIMTPNDIYVAGGVIRRFDGANWNTVEIFPSINQGVLSAIDFVQPCELYGVGRQVVAGQIAPFAARIDSATYWHAEVLAPSTPDRAPATISVLAPPRPGHVMTIGVGDDAGVLMPSAGAAVAYLFFSTGPSASYPLGDLYPVGGSNSGPGELFISPAGVVATTGPALWFTGLAPAAMSRTIPNLPALAGFVFFAQGVLVDVVQPSRVLFTPGLELRIGL